MANPVVVGPGGQPVGPTAAATTEPLIEAVRCPNGHSNAPGTTACRVCRAPLAGARIEVMPEPLIARLRAADGTVVDLDRALLLGRAPSEQRSTVPLPRLVTLASPGTGHQPDPPAGRAGELAGDRRRTSIRPTAPSSPIPGRAAIADCCHQVSRRPSRSVPCSSWARASRSPSSPGTSGHTEAATGYPRSPHHGRPSTTSGPCCGAAARSRARTVGHTFRRVSDRQRCDHLDRCAAGRAGLVHRSVSGGHRHRRFGTDARLGGAGLVDVRGAGSGTRHAAHAPAARRPGERSARSVGAGSCFVS